MASDALLFTKQRARTTRILSARSHRADAGCDLLQREDWQRQRAKLVKRTSLDCAARAQPGRCRPVAWPDGQHPTLPSAKAISWDVKSWIHTTVLKTSPIPLRSAPPGNLAPDTLGVIGQGGEVIGPVAVVDDHDTAGRPAGPCVFEVTQGWFKRAQTVNEGAVEAGVIARKERVACYGMGFAAKGRGIGLEIRIHCHLGRRADLPEDEPRFAPYLQIAFDISFLRRAY